MLEGADLILPYTRFVFMEAIHLAWKNAGYGPSDVFDLLHRYGLVPVKRDHHGHVLEAISRQEFATVQPDGSRNLLWARLEDLAKLRN